MARIGYAGAAFKRYSVPGSAMAPTLRPGSHVRCTKRVPDRIERGTIVVFEGHGEPWAVVPGLTFLFRVVGLPGETVSSSPDGYDVRVNGVRLAEPYADKAGFLSDFPERSLGADEYFVLGDNRDGAADSRDNGPIRRHWVVAVCDP